MASLTDTAIISRKIIKYSFYLIALILVVRYTIIFGNMLYKSFFPQPPPKPEVKFGKLPKINFPTNLNYDELTLSLETPEGELPNIVPQANVYFMPKSSPSIQDPDNARLKAKNLSFSSEARQLSDTVYLFESTDGKPTTLTMNIVTNSFSISYDLTADENFIYSQPQVPESAVKTAQSYISKAGLMPNDASEDDATIEYLKISQGEFKGAISLSEADVVKVNFFRKKYDELPSMTPDPKEANIWFITGPRSRGSRPILAGVYHYYPIDEQQKSSYPLKKVSDAWEELRSGKAFIARFGENDQNAQIKIRRVYLGYYDPGEYAEFYQPVYVFEGDNEFYAYVPAISAEYYGSE